MVTDSTLTQVQDERLREMTDHIQALDAYPPAELAELLASPALEAYARRVVEAIAALRTVSAAHPPDIVASRIVAEIKYSGAARKVSVSMPEELTAAVQQRVGRGKFSQYVTGAVARQLELDLLSELSGLLTGEYGPVPEKYLVEAQLAWPGRE